MAPTLSNKENTLEDTIAKIYETLKRTENTTLETKRRAAKDIEKNEQHLKSSTQIATKVLNPVNHFSESLNHADCTRLHDIHHGMVAPKYSTLGNKKSQGSLPTKPSPPNPKENVRKSADNNSTTRTNKVRLIIFKTLDRLFQIPNNSLKSSTRAPPPKPKQHKPTVAVTKPHSSKRESLSLETLKLLNENTTDTIPRDSSIALHHDKDALLAENEKPSEVDVGSSCDESSSEDETWQFIPAPLKFEQVTIEDTFEQKSSNTSSDTGTEQKDKKNRYQRKSQKGTDKNKIKKRVQDRQRVKKNEMEEKEQIQNSEKAITCRPGSPVMKKSVRKIISSAGDSSKMIETLRELDSSTSSSDCGTDTFNRNIAYCACSTLSKSVPSFSENHENDDDACSSSSSFSSLQRINSVYDNSRRCTHESTLPIPVVPSALRNDVLVTPINVLTCPFPQTGNTVIGITPETFKDLTEVYAPSNENISKNIKDITSGTSEFETISLSSSNNTSLPPPPPPTMPPPPPPPPSFSISTTSTVRGLLPLPIFTQPQSGNCIFKEMKQISIDKRDVKRFQENFPLKSAGDKASKRFKGKAKDISPEQEKFLQHIELFLKKYQIVDFQPLVESIKTLDAGNTQVETECFTTLLQSISKADKEPRRFEPKNTKVEKFVFELLSVEDVHTKLKCIQFSLDFMESSAKVFKWADSFIKTCDKIKICEKFVQIINVIMHLLQSLNSDEQSKIYGFDIQGLTKLATKTSADGSSTFLQFVIEYILSQPSLTDSVDFYKAFTDLPDLTKTSVKEMRAQCDEWKRSLQTYNAQVEKIKQKQFGKVGLMGYATTFQRKAEDNLRKLNEKLDEAQNSFHSCKERFGLMSSGTSEVAFFESLSSFIIAYQKTYKDIKERKEKANKKPTLPKYRLSLGGITARNSRNSISPKRQPENTDRRKSGTVTEIESNMKAEKETNVVHKRGNGIQKENPRRKSLAPGELENMLDSSSTREVGKSLVQLLLTKNSNDYDKVKRLRKSCGSKSSSNLPLCREK